MNNNSPRRSGETCERIEAANAEIGKGFTPAMEEQIAILKARAQELARAPAREQPAEQSMDIVEFSAAHETYALEIRFVREALNLKDITPVPCTPRYIAGIINVRGQILAVIDIKRFFDLPARGIADVHTVIIVKNETMDFGLLADVILGVRTVLLSRLQPTPPTFTGIRAEYLKGVTQEGVVILDAGKILSDRSIVVNEQVEA